MKEINFRGYKYLSDNQVMELLNINKSMFELLLRKNKNEIYMNRDYIICKGKDLDELKISYKETIDISKRNFRLWRPDGFLKLNILIHSDNDIRKPQIVFEGLKYKTYKELCESYDVNYEEFKYRKNKLKLPLKDCIYNLPKKINVQQKTKHSPSNGRTSLLQKAEHTIYRWNGETYHSLTELSKACKVSRSTLTSFMSKGFDVDEIIEKVKQVSGRN